MGTEYSVGVDDSADQASVPQRSVLSRQAREILLKAESRKPPSKMLTIFFAHGWAVSPERLAVAAAVTVGFAVLAHVLRGVNRSAAVAGGLVCFALFWGAGPGAFATLAGPLLWHGVLNHVFS